MKLARDLLRYCGIDMIGLSFMRHLGNMRYHGPNTYHLNGIFSSFFCTNGTALLLSTRNMAAELPVMLEVLTDDLEN